MNIGLTYDLKSYYLARGLSEEAAAEFDREDTVEAIEASLAAMGHRTERIGNLFELISRLSAGHRWDLVFNIAEGLYGIGREAQVPAVLDAFGIPYTFSDPLVLCLTLHKGMTKRVIRDAGVSTSDFAVVEKPEDVEAVSFNPPFFVKPVAEGTGKGISSASRVQDAAELAAVTTRLLMRYPQGILVERYLPGREFTIGILGTGDSARALGTIEVHLESHAQPGAYGYENKKYYEERVRYRLLSPETDAVVAEAEALSLKAWRVLGCRDAGRIDVRCDEAGQPQFIEVNPLAGIHPIHSDLPILCNLAGISYQSLIEKIIASACLRLEK
ncbi:MAG: D-alanine--D-alanine ligase [Desulfobacterales bacterium CG23_combo_of_CG06-09_8_20_14_all_52_9]|nr:MAG: D-alanine--D-alanine ligase [Desulfobacterales bacterium CG23_combo_of_CG06-09_8_20_14_all_52_9]